MQGVLGADAGRLDLANIEQSAVACLCRLEGLIASGMIDPWFDASPGTVRPLPGASREWLRVGVFPTAANPFHWAHLLAGLFVIDRFALDRVIYIVAGHDPRKPDMESEEQRHAMAKSVLSLFEPLLAYSPVARGTSVCGEENFFRLLDDFHARRTHGFYIAGSDHYHRFRPGTEHPDTIVRLEEGITRGLLDRQPGRRRVSVVFLQRGRRAGPEETWLDVRWVPGLPVETSSTAIRRALADGRRRATLSSLPFAVLKSIRRNHLYHIDIRDLPALSDEKRSRR
jgi:nicotinic acid mononucleotide adenylyltransferase